MSIVEAHEIAERLGLVASESQLREIDYAIRDAVADVEGYLQYGIEVTTYTETGLVDDVHDGWKLSQLPVSEIISATPELEDGQPTGYYTVVYKAGLDVGVDGRYDAIKRYVVAHAVNAPSVLALWRASLSEGERLGRVTSLSTEGQSISFEGATQGASDQGPGTSPGALPKLESLRRWQHIPISRRRSETAHRLGWPYG